MDERIGRTVPAESLPECVRELTGRAGPTSHSSHRICISHPHPQAMLVRGRHHRSNRKSRNTWQKSGGTGQTGAGSTRKAKVATVERGSAIRASRTQGHSIGVITVGAGDTQAAMSRPSAVSSICAQSQDPIRTGALHGARRACCPIQILIGLAGGPNAVHAALEYKKKEKEQSGDCQGGERERTMKHTHAGNRPARRHNKKRREARVGTHPTRNACPACSGPTKGKQIPSAGIPA